ncbi:MAG: hypothetical protein JWR59_1398 [Brevundimonas sp.]|nr:hypothetical protein [Brevundimonas sp.]
MSVRRSVAWAYTGQIFSLAASFVTSIIIARLLSPHEMGVYAIAMATVGIIEVATAFGVGAYVVRDPDLQPETLDTAFTVNAILATGLSLVLLIVSFAAGPLLGDVAAGRVLRVIFLMPLIGIFAFRPATMLQREMRFKAISVIAAMGIIINGLVTVTAALSGASYMSLAYGTISATTFTLIANVAVAPRHAATRLSLSAWRDMTTFGLRMMSISGVSVLVAKVGELVLGRTLGLASLGLYSRASNLSNLIFTNIYGTATRVIFTQLAKDYRETGELRETFLRSFSIVTAVMWPFLLMLAIFARPTIHLLYGEKWMAAAGPLSILLIGQFLALFFGMNWELFVLRNETARQTRLEVSRSAIALAAFVIGCQFNLLAAAFGRVVDGIVGLIVYFPHVNRLAQTRPGELLRIYRDNLVLTAATTGPAFGLMLATGWSAKTSWLAIIPAAALGVGLWFVVMALMRHPLFLEIQIWSRAGLARLAPARTDT